MITKTEFERVSKKPKYKSVFEFFKENKDTAFTKADIKDKIATKVGMSETQLVYSLWLWKKVGYLEHANRHYLVTPKGLETAGKVTKHQYQETVGA